MGWVISVLLVVFGVQLVLYSMFWPPDSPWAPWWRTTRKVALLQCLLAEVGPGDLVYDLGAGDGTFLFVAARRFGARGIGFEVDFIRVLFGRALLRLGRVSDKAKIVRGNLFQADLSMPSVVVAYLVPAALLALEGKLLADGSPGMRVVTYRYALSGKSARISLVAHDRDSRSYVYRLEPKGEAETSDPNPRVGAWVILTG